MLRMKRRVVVRPFDCRKDLHDVNRTLATEAESYSDFRGTCGAHTRVPDAEGINPGVGCLQDAAGIHPRCERSEESLSGRSSVERIFPVVNLL